jgi:hypothetical protein
LVVLGAATAHADPAAEQLFRDGKELVAAGKLDEGCDKLQRSQDLEKRSGTLLNLADCREKQGRLTVAWEMFLEAKSLAAQQGNELRVAEADRRIAAIVPRLAHLTVKLPPTERRHAGTVVLHDGIAMPPALYDVAAPVDPRTHVIEVRAPAYRPWKKELALAPGSTSVVEVPALKLDFAPRLRRGAIGLTFGTYRHSFEPALGVRAVVGFPASGGQIRANLTVVYAYVTPDALDPTNFFHIVAPGVAVEYLAAYRPNLAFAAGLGTGLELSYGNYNQFTTTDGWIAPRVSPVIYRKDRFEVGLHLSFVIPQGRLVGLVGLDWFL